MLSINPIFRIDAVFFEPWHLAPNKPKQQQINFRISDTDSRKEWSRHDILRLWPEWRSRPERDPSPNTPNPRPKLTGPKWTTSSWSRDPPRPRKSSPGAYSAPFPHPPSRSSKPIYCWNIQSPTSASSASGKRAGPTTSPHRHNIMSTTSKNT